MDMATHHMEKCHLEPSNFRRFKWGGLSLPVLFQEWKSPPWKGRNINNHQFWGSKFWFSRMSRLVKHWNSTMVTSSLPTIELFENDLREFENRQYSRPFFRWGLYFEQWKRRSRSFTSSKCHQFMNIYLGCSNAQDSSHYQNYTTLILHSM